MTQRYVWLALMTAGFIVYGSLAPFHWYPGASDQPIRYLLGHWNRPTQPLPGLLGNIALYLPLGLFISLALAQRARWVRWLVIPALASSLLCLGIELIQVYDWGRKATLTDVYCNVAGTLAGAMLADRMPRCVRHPTGTLEPPLVLILLLAFLVTELYPFAPTLHAHFYTEALVGLFTDFNLPVLALVHCALLWLVAANLLRHLFGPRHGYVGWAMLALAVFVGQVIVPAHPLLFVEWVSVAAVALVLPVIASLGQACSVRFSFAALVIGQGGLILAHTASTSDLAFAEFDGQSWIDISSHGIAAFYLVGATVWTLYQTGRPALRAGLVVALIFGLIALAAAWLDQGDINFMPSALALIAAGVLALSTRRPQSDNAAGIGA
ncbi:MAG: hypothetical protein CMP08_03885 [Xanthomonadales bacterium]|nr:hypothetical protein [Xanthomonadales bacterium]